MLWVIKDQCHGRIGMVEKKEDIIKFLVYNEWIDEFTNVEFDYFNSLSLWIVLDMENSKECTKEKIVEKFNLMSENEFAEILDRMGFFVVESQPWSYAKYLHDNQ